MSCHQSYPQNSQHHNHQHNNQHSQCQHTHNHQHTQNRSMNHNHNHRSMNNRRKLTESVENVGGQRCLVIKNVEKPKLAFVAFHDWNEESSDMQPLSREFFMQYPDVHAVWVIPDTPFRAVEAPTSLWNDDANLADGIQKMCNYEPHGIKHLRADVLSLLTSVKRTFDVSMEWTCLVGEGQGCVIALDCLFHMSQLPRALGLWNPVPALFSSWRSLLRATDETKKEMLLKVPIFVQDNSTRASRGLSSQLVDLFLSFEGFTMTSFNDDHLGPNVTPTDAGNFFRFVDPPRGWYVLKPLDTKKVAAIFAKAKEGKNKYFCGWPFQGKSIV